MTFVLFLQLLLWTKCSGHLPEQFSFAASGEESDDCSINRQMVELVSWEIT